MTRPRGNDFDGAGDLGSEAHDRPFAVGFGDGGDGGIEFPLFGCGDLGHFGNGCGFCVSGFGLGGWGFLFRKFFGHKGVGWNEVGETVWF